MARRWSDAELALALDRSLPVSEVAQRLGRTVGAVRSARAMYPQGRVKSVEGRKFRWSPDEVAVLLDESLTTAQVSQRLGRAVGAVYAARRRYGKEVPAGATQAQAAEIANAVKGHQDTINTAVSALKDEMDTTARGIDDASQRIRVRGDEAGDGDLAALEKPAEEDAGRLSEEDGKALADEAAKLPHQRGFITLQCLMNSSPNQVVAHLNESTLLHAC